MLCNSGELTIIRDLIWRNKIRKSATSLDNKSNFLCVRHHSISYINSSVSAPDKNMLGEQFAELKGKMMGQRVLDSEGATLETSVSARGIVKGIQVNETLTYVARLTSS